MKVILTTFLALLFNAASVYAASNAVVLVYHHVDATTPPSTSLSPEEFKAHLDFLVANEFSVLPLPDIITALQNGTPLPNKTAAITFDDGFRSIYETAYPMLQKLNMPFTLFLSTGPVDSGQSNYLNWDEIREMGNTGVTIANHTVDHPYMVNRPTTETEEEWLERNRFQIEHAEARIFEETGQSHRIFAYPYGEFNAELKTLLETLDFVAFAQNSGAMNAASDTLALPRFPLASYYANLETAGTKILSKAFDVELVFPNSPIARGPTATATLRFAPGNYRMEQVACFEGGEPMSMQWSESTAGELRLAGPMRSSRRWRYICTAPEKDSRRFYWYSIPWINLDN